MSIYFLNRGTYHGVKKFADISVPFIGGPGGYTPSADALLRVDDENYPSKEEIPLLIMFTTDGLPTDVNGDTKCQRERMREVLTATKKRRMCVSILACTDDDEVMEWSNVLDKEVPNVDVIIF